MNRCPAFPAGCQKGEHILWQGAPSSAQVSRQIMKTRWIAGYFAVLVLWNVSAGIYDGRLPSEILFSSGALAILAPWRLGCSRPLPGACRKPQCTRSPTSGL
jgi:hypothetical protein